MAEDFWSVEPGPRHDDVVKRPSPTEAHDAERLRRQAQWVRTVLGSPWRWAVVVGLAIAYCLLVLSRVLPGSWGAPLIPVWIPIALALVFGALGVYGMFFFDSSMRLYEQTNERYYRKRRRQFGPELNALIANVLFAAAGIGTLLACLLWLAGVRLWF